MKPLDGDPRKLQNPAQSAKGEERRDRERNPWLAKMLLLVYEYNLEFEFIFEKVL